MKTKEQKLKATEYQKKYRQNNSDKVKKRRQKYYDNHRNFVDELKICCVACGEDNKCCLDFHHVGQKDFVIAEKMTYSMERILNELSKCVVVCANCHRKIHAGNIDDTKLQTIG